MVILDLTLPAFLPIMSLICIGLNIQTFPTSVHAIFFSLQFLHIFSAQQNIISSKKPSVIMLFKVIESFLIHHSYIFMVCFIQDIYYSRILSSIFIRFSSLLLSASDRMLHLKDTSCNRAWTLPFHLRFSLQYLVLFLAHNKCSM